MASLDETGVDLTLNTTESVVSTSLHDTSEVSEGNTTFNTCLDETIRLSDLDTSTASFSSEAALDLTIPKLEAAEDDSVAEAVTEVLDVKSSLETEVLSDVGVQEDVKKSEPTDEVTVKNEPLEDKPDDLVVGSKQDNQSDKAEVNTPLTESTVQPEIESAKSESITESQELQQVKPPLVLLDTENLPVIKSQEYSKVVPIKIEMTKVEPSADQSATVVAKLDESIKSELKLDEHRDSSSRPNESLDSCPALDKSVDSVKTNPLDSEPILDKWVDSNKTLDKSLDSAPSVDEILSDSAAEETLHVAEYEREEGDGQEYDSSDGEIGTSESEGEDEAPVEQVKEKKIDDDEDRRNPQYIPKRGTFYEHDDRTADEDTGTGNNAETETDRANEQNADKKVWKEHENRWTHDGYNEEDQKPKSRQEIIETYGYDIRNEENAPRAVRRNKYGRGPNTYTRTWEDENAYKRPSGAPTAGGRGGNRGRDRDRERDREREQPRSQTYYSNKVSGRNSDRPLGQRKEAFPALPSGHDGNNDASRSASPPPREERQSSAWSRREPQQQPPPTQRKPAKEEYSSYGNNLPLQLTPPPQRRDVEVMRVAVAQQPPPARFAQPSSDNIKPFRKSSGRGTVTAKDAAREQLLREQLPGRGRGQPPPSTAGKRGGSGRISGDVRELVEPAKHAREPVGNAQWGKSQPGSVAPKFKNQHDLANDLARMNVSPAAAQKAPPVEHPHYPGAAHHDYQRRPAANEPPRSNQGYPPQQQQHDRRQTEVPPRLQQQEAAAAKEAAASRPKRYSTIQQRSLPEPGAPIPQQQQQQQAPAYAQPQQHQYYQHPPNYVQQPQQPPLQLMAAVHPPTTYAGTFPTPPAFIQPAPAPPPHMMRRPPSPGHYHPPPGPPQAVIGYVQQNQPPQFQPQPYPPFQAFAAVAPPPPQPADLGLYQPQGGITYYSPEEQMRSRQLTSERRQRAAIPIVPPPEYGRATGYDQQEYGGMGDQGSYSDEDGQDDDYDDYNGGGDATEGIPGKVKQRNG